VASSEPVAPRRHEPLGARPEVNATTADGPVLLLGTAHVVDLSGPIRRILGDRPLDGIAVELDPERAHALFAEGDPRAHRPRGVPLVARLWSHLQRRLGAELGGGGPGEEMKVAARIAHDRRLPLLLIDDPIRATLASLLSTMPFKERVSVLVGAVVGLFVPSRVVEREMDRYVDDPLGFAAELRRASPTLAKVLLDDRNEHMADRLASVRLHGYRRIAAVVGDAHLPGLADALRRRGVPVEAIALRELRGVTARSPSSS